MRHSLGGGWRLLATLCVVGLCLLAGCADLLGDGVGGTYDVPSPTTGGTPDTARTGVDDQPNGTDDAIEANESRYFELRPNCERPPSLVIAIQVGALRNDGPQNRGIRTVYAFAAPSNRRAVGPLPSFVRLIERGFRPLLAATRVAYGPLERSNGTAITTVTVTTPDGNETAYRWQVERQESGSNAGCWMTVSVSEVGTVRPEVESDDRKSPVRTGEGRRRVV